MEFLLSIPEKRPASIGMIENQKHHHENLPSYTGKETGNKFFSSQEDPYQVGKNFENETDFIEKLERVWIGDEGSKPMLSCPSFCSFSELADIW